MRKNFAACVFVGLCILLVSCGPRTIGYGVVLWGQAEGPVTTGTVAALIEVNTESRICLLLLPGGKTPVEFPSGRLRIFPARSEAEQYAKSLAPFLSTWAFSQKQDLPPLPVRETARTSAEAVYKLKQGQVVKIIGRSAKTELIKPFESYWYELVTDDGYAGWCFGHYLKVFTAEGDPTTTAARLLSEDPTLDRILGTVWRPDWFREMMNTGRIDLAKFREDIGFFPQPEQNSFKLALPTYSKDFSYNGIERLSNGNYEATGSGLRIRVLDEERISLSYIHKNLETGGLFSVMEEEVAEVIAKEQERREGVYAALLAKGAALSSSAYGSIGLESGMRFTWTGFEKLVPSVIPAGTGGDGRVDFGYHLSRGLSTTYDGVITFVFDKGTAAGTSFLYSFASGGIRLTSLAKDSFSEIEVTKASLSPVVIFFTQGQTP